MQVALDVKDLKCETISFEDEIKEISRTMKLDRNVKKVKLNFYWDSHGHLVPWEVDGKTSKTYDSAHVQLEEVVQHYQFDKDCKPIEFTFWDVKINGESVRAIDCYEYYTTSTGMLVFKMIVGQG